jgi:hypothetical protein
MKKIIETGSYLILFQKEKERPFILVQRYNDDKCYKTFREAKENILGINLKH